MKTAVGFVCAAVAVQLASAQIVERPRPAGWENLVFGGRFMDRFEQPEVIGDGWTSACWGGDNVKPRDVRNGIEVLNRLHAKRKNVSPVKKSCRDRKKKDLHGKKLKQKKGKKQNEDAVKSGLTMIENSTLLPALVLRLQFMTMVSLKTFSKRKQLIFR